MVDVFDRHGVRFDPRLTGCSRFVRYSDYAALEAQLAGATAENERLKRVNNGLHDEVQFMRQAVKENREALSRTGAVKVKGDSHNESSGVE